jgi:tetratricopeptide (TPR) repeat protein
MGVKRRSCGARWLLELCRYRYALRLAAAAFLGFLCNAMVPAQQGASDASSTIQGTVHDRAGVSVSDASVVLERAGSEPVKTTTGADGTFYFSSLVPGTYVLHAEKAGQYSSPITVNSGSSANVQAVNLTFDAFSSASPDKRSAPSAASMEFADNPNFTVAAVTDWTAAGGHGSDSVLRTSEALNRETVALKPQNGGNGPSSQSGQSKQTESTLRAAVASDPQSFEANRKLGEFYLHAAQFHDAVAPLEAAYKIDPNHVGNEYDLALALQGNGDFPAAREHAQKLIARDENANLHRLLGEIDENLNDPLAAVHEFERAVREDPSEENYFAWGSELLLHRAIWQAKDVFTAGVKAYPKSARMLTALGAALFAGAMYDEAAQRLCEASDLNPADPAPYLFMGKIEMASPNPLPCVEQKLARFLQLRPADPLANYYYAMTLWKQKGTSVDQSALGHVQDLLTKAVAVDPKCADAYLQLGVLEATRRDFKKAIGYYNKAIDVNPQLSEAHYRLGIAYDRVGERDKARQQFQLHDEIEKQQAAAVEKQRREVKQFLVVVDGKAPDTTPR